MLLFAVYSTITFNKIFNDHFTHLRLRVDNFTNSIFKVIVMITLINVTFKMKIKLSSPLKLVFQWKSRSFWFIWKTQSEKILHLWSSASLSFCLDWTFKDLSFHVMEGVMAFEECLIPKIDEEWTNLFCPQHRLQNSHILAAVNFENCFKI